MTEILSPSLSVKVDEENFVAADLFYGLNDLHRLTKMLVAFMGELDFGTSDDRNHDLDSAYSVAKIISDQVKILAILAGPLDRPNKQEAGR